MARTPNTKKGTRPPKEQSSTKNFDIVDLEKNSRIPDQSATPPQPCYHYRSTCHKPRYTY